MIKYTETMNKLTQLQAHKHFETFGAVIFKREVMATTMLNDIIDARRSSEPTDIVIRLEDFVDFEYKPLVDLIIDTQGVNFERDPELKEVVELKRYIWTIQVKKVRELFVTMKLNFEEAAEKIEDQYISPYQLTNSEFEMSEEEEIYIIKKEETKRDLFLKALKEEFRKFQ